MSRHKIKEITFYAYWIEMMVDGYGSKRLKYKDGKWSGRDDLTLMLEVDCR